MLSLLVAGVLLSGSITQTVSHSQGTAGPFGGAVFGTRVTVSKTFPAAPPPTWASLTASGTKSLRYCALPGTQANIRFATTDPRGCQYAGGSFPLWYWI